MNTTENEKINEIMNKLSLEDLMYIYINGLKIPENDPLGLNLSNNIREDADNGGT